MDMNRSVLVWFCFCLCTLHCLGQSPDYNLGEFVTEECFFCYECMVPVVLVHNVYAIYPELAIEIYVSTWSRNWQPQTCQSLLTA